MAADPKMRQGPLWMMESNAETQRKAAESARADAVRSIRYAEEADIRAVEYEEAAALLRAAKQGGKQ
jgi:hypothetical protein